MAEEQLDKIFGYVLQEYLSQIMVCVCGFISSLKEVLGKLNGTIEVESCIRRRFQRFTFKNTGMYQIIINE